MSIEACAPPLHEAARRGGPLGAALQQAAAGQGGGNGAARPPVFQSVRGGVARMVDALAAELADAVSLSTPVQHLSLAARAGGGPRWEVATPRGSLDASAVIAACPAPESARLLEHLAPDAAGILGDIDYADVALATFVVPDEHLVRPLDGSGFLVPRSRGLLTTACSWSSSKWQHYARAGLAVLRVSAGRIDDWRWMDLDSDDLLSTLAAELTPDRRPRPRRRRPGLPASPAQRLEAVSAAVPAGPSGPGGGGGGLPGRRDARPRGGRRRAARFGAAGVHPQRADRSRDRGEAPMTAPGSHNPAIRSGQTATATVARLLL